MYKKRIGLSVGALQAKYGDRETLEFVKQIGADAVDFDLSSARFDVRNPDSIYAKSHDEILSYYSELKRYADTLGLQISQTHGRIVGFTEDREWNDIVERNAQIDCLVTRALGAPVCVMHGVSTGRMGADCDPNLMRNLNCEMFCRCLKWAKHYEIKIATETFGDSEKYGCCDFFGNTDEFLKSYNRISAMENNSDYFAVCVDTGHSNKAMRFNQNPTPADVIRMLGHKVEVLHLNDNDTKTDQHKIPFTGTIDWNDVFDALDEIQYDKIYNMELNLSYFGNGLEKETAEFAVKVLRRFLDSRYGA